MSNEFEKTVRVGVSGSRWLLAPMYLGLALMLIVLLIQFVRDFFRNLPELFQMSALDTLPTILTLGVILLASNIVLTILQTGRELFAAGVRSDDDLTNGRGQLDFAKLRNRFLGISIALALLLLLREMLANAGSQPAEGPESYLALAALIGVLVLSALILAVADWFAWLRQSKSD